MYKYEEEFAIGYDLHGENWTKRACPLGRAGPSPYKQCLIYQLCPFHDLLS